MLKRTIQFLNPERGLLYLVLPLPCIRNSRYMDHEHLIHIMTTIGYQSSPTYHFSKKLAYYAFQLDNTTKNKLKSMIPKKLRHDKPGRNKYCGELFFFFF